ncbi:MAG: hypothetical protein VX185_06960 [Pseudomonadota bacterium]|nr:hypothetical protein [Pseudomonadota bacterium]
MAVFKIISLIVVAMYLTGCGGAASDEVTDARSIVDDLVDVGTGSGTNGDSTADAGEGQDTTDGSNNGSNDAVADNDEPTESNEEAPPYTQDTLTASITWTPSNYYEDGSTMSSNEISHYQIVYGSAADNLDQVYEISLAGLLSFDFEALANQTWYVAVKTVSIYGGVSDPSNIVALNF